MKNNTVTFDINVFKSYLFTIIECSYELGIAYANNKPSISKEEAIKRVQDMHWEKLQDIINHD